MGLYGSATDVREFKKALHFFTLAGFFDSVSRIDSNDGNTYRIGGKHYAYNCSSTVARLG